MLAWQPRPGLPDGSVDLQLRLPTLLSFSLPYSSSSLEPVAVQWMPWSGRDQNDILFDVALDESTRNELTELRDELARVFSDFFSPPVAAPSAHQLTGSAFDPEPYKCHPLRCYTVAGIKRVSDFSESNRERDIREFGLLAAAASSFFAENAPGIPLLTRSIWWIYGVALGDVCDCAKASFFTSAQSQDAFVERAFGSPSHIHLDRVRAENRGYA